MARKLEHLLSSIKVGKVSLRNRIIKPSQTMKYADNEGYVTRRNIDFYDALGRGGAGMVIIENSSIDQLGGQGPTTLRIDDDRYISGLTHLAETLHKHGCVAFIQLGHSGPASRRQFSGLQSVAASALSQADLPLPVEPPREATVSDIRAITEQYAAAAERAREAGFDGIEIHAAHAYLLNTFISRIWNRRQDSYGPQTFENRARFASEVITAIRQSLGTNFAIGIRINGAEWGKEQGTTSGESRGFAQILEKAGADYVHVSAMGYGTGPYAFVKYPEPLLFPDPAGELAARVKKSGALVPLAEAIKKAVRIPVITVGRLDPLMGEAIIAGGHADIIAMGRRLLADPELPLKVAEGRFGDIRPCLGCLECRDRLDKGEPVQCRVNASLGHEGEYPIIPASSRKTVFVVGGGPSGMEAARVAALRGHEVTLFEKEPKLGGQVRIARLVKGDSVEDLPGLIRYYENQLRKLGVRLRTGREFRPSLLAKTRPDALILACGGMPAGIDIRGINGRNVLDSLALHRKVKPYLRFISPEMLNALTKYWLPVGKRVVIIGGQIQGCETAEFLVKRGRQVTVIESGDQLGTGIPAIGKTRLLAWLREKGTRFITGAQVDSITHQGVVVFIGGKKESIPADTVLPIIPFVAGSVVQQYKEKVAEVYAVGDYREPHLILEAIADGLRTARTI